MIAMNECESPDLSRVIAALRSATSIKTFNSTVLTARVSQRATGSDASTTAVHAVAFSSP